MPDRKSALKQTAFVTGASYGIGAATALALARDGYELALSATRLENLAAIRAKLEAMGTKMVPIALDIRSHASIDNALDEAVGALGRLDVLVNNAGVTLRKKALEVTAQEWETVIGTNVTGTFFMSQQMGRYLIDNGRPGCIINMGSTHGLVGMSGRSTYGISKAAISQMTRMLAIEWAEHGIRVNAIAPGRVDSKSPARAATSNDPKYLESALNRIPLRRFATVEDVAEAVRYLASPAAACITGQTLVLDGGLTAQ
jgi:NAD(P)-dependent dehydrogenase (short-subunit alcohol dehydrogenase family)